MEIPTKGKKFPWVWAAVGCGVLLIAVIALAVIAFFAALPSIRNALANLNLNSFQTPAPQFSPTLAPNTNGGNGTIIGDLPFKFSAVQDMSALGTQSLMDQMSTTLNLNSDTDFMAPKTYKGSSSLDPTAPFTLGNGWCAADSATLQQNLASMQFQLSINGQNIDLGQYPTLYFSDNQGHACAMTGVLITPNGNMRGNFHIVLTQKYLKSLSDGITASPYPSGDVTFDFSFKFQAAPSNGTQT